MRFQVAHLKGSKFSRRGLRGYFEHRDDVDVQFVYVLKGWAVFEYEGIGRRRRNSGLMRRRNLQPESHRAVVDEADLHIGAE
jgi:hypothetical protein